MKYILFDLDGTLTDPEEGITKSVAYSLESFGIKVDNLEDLRKFIGPPLKDSYMEFYQFSEEEALHAIQKYREYFPKKGIYENKIYAGIRDLLEALRGNGKKLLLATSKPTVYAKIILDYFDIAEYFSVIAGSELDGSRVDKSEVIAYAFEQAKIVDQEEAVMIGDRKHDILGAKKMGISSIGVLYGYGSREELEQAKADRMVESVKELKDLLLLEYC